MFYQHCASRRYGHVYRDMLRVHNRGKTALKCELLVPDELRGCLEFLPPLGFPQAGDYFDFQLKLRPNENIWRRMGAEFGDARTGVIELPMVVTVPDQSLPVRWVLKTQLTRGELSFEPDTLDFGRCAVSESVQIDVTVTNTSILPQQLGFVRLVSGTPL